MWYHMLYAFASIAPCQAELQRRDDDGIGEAAQSEENSQHGWMVGIGWDGKHVLMAGSV